MAGPGNKKVMTVDNVEIGCIKLRGAPNKKLRAAERMIRVCTKSAENLLERVQSCKAELRRKIREEMERDFGTIEEPRRIAEEQPKKRKASTPARRMDDSDGDNDLAFGLPNKKPKTKKHSTPSRTKTVSLTAPVSNKKNTGGVSDACNNTSKINTPITTNNTLSPKSTPRATLPTPNDTTTNVVGSPKTTTLPTPNDTTTNVVGSPKTAPVERQPPAPTKKAPASAPTRRIKQFFSPEEKIKELQSLGYLVSFPKSKITAPNNNALTEEEMEDIRRRFTPAMETASCMEQVALMKSLGYIDAHGKYMGNADDDLELDIPKMSQQQISVVLRFIETQEYKKKPNEAVSSGSDMDIDSD